jgi:Bacterial PH domain
VHHLEVTEKQPNPGRKAIFRVPGISFLAIVFLMVCLIPVAFNGVPGLWALYVVPLGLILFVVRTRTVATAQGLAIRTMFGHRELPWEALKGLAITKRSKVRAVLPDDSQIPLPTVRTRHLPVLALVSEGRLKDPSGLTDTEEPPEEPTERP